MKEKINVIVDTDPGVDDSVAEIVWSRDEKLNILLYTTVSGNVELPLCTTNLLHVLDVCESKVPVAVGAEKPLKREPINARYIHGQGGLGNYIPLPSKRKPLKTPAVEAMYRTIKANKGNISVILLAPQTNMAMLLQKHPDVKDMINEIVFMGASDYENDFMKHHVSFNISSDPEAFEIVLNSGIPLTMIPSEIGRKNGLTEEQVESLKENKKVGHVLYSMLSAYWEPNMPEKFVAMNDSLAMFYLTHKNIFKTKKADILLDLKKIPGKTVFSYHKNGKVNCVVKVNKKKFHKLFFKSLSKIV